VYNLNADARAGCDYRGGAFDRGRKYGGKRSAAGLHRVGPIEDAETLA